MLRGRLNCSIRRPLPNREIALGTRNGGWGHAGLFSFGCSPAARLGAVGHEPPGRTAGIRDRESARLASARRDWFSSASWFSTLPIPLSGGAREEEGLNLSRVQSGSGEATGPVG